MKVFKNLDKRKVAKYSLLAGCCIGLVYASYKIGCEKSDYNIIKLIKNDGEAIQEFKSIFTDETVTVYMHYEA